MVYKMVKWWRGTSLFIFHMMAETIMYIARKNKWYFYLLTSFVKPNSQVSCKLQKVSGFAACSLLGRIVRVCLSVELTSLLLQKMSGTCCLSMHTVTSLHGAEYTRT